MTSPKVFLSYSWTTPEHQARVREWAERLLSDGVQVVLDVFDLREGQDKYAFMEKMVTDGQITHVLMFCDAEYSRKADSRRSGVGTESQIISQEVYEKAEQSKFVPIVCEFGTDGQPALPVYLRSRIWMDFSTPEAVNSNWERLVRHLFGKPLFEKPALGQPPAYLAESTSAAAGPALTRYTSFRQAALQGRRDLRTYREDFLQTLFTDVDGLRVRTQPDQATLGQDTLALAERLVTARNMLVDWVQLEQDISDPASLNILIHEALEDLLYVKLRAPELNPFNELWVGAHALFGYETFLYFVAALMKGRRYDSLHELFATHYLKPENHRDGASAFASFQAFWGAADVLQEVLAPPGRRLYSPTAEFLKKHADRADLPWPDIIQADLLAFLMSMISGNGIWYPQTMHYAGYSSSFTFFLRATQHSGFKDLVRITGVASADDLREKVKAGLEAFSHYSVEGLHHINFWHALNMSKLDTLR